MGDGLVVSLKGEKGTKSNLIEFEKFSALSQIPENTCERYNASRKYRFRVFRGSGDSGSVILE